MSAKLISGYDEKTIEMVVKEAWYSGDRYVIQGQEGSLAAIVPIEDLALLEELEGDL